MKTTYEIAFKSAWDSGNRSMKRRKGKKWNQRDFQKALQQFDTLMGFLEQGKEYNEDWPEREG